MVLKGDAGLHKVVSKLWSQLYSRQKEQGNHALKDNKKKLQNQTFQTESEMLSTI